MLLDRGFDFAYSVSAVCNARVVELDGVRKTAGSATRMAYLAVVVTDITDRTLAVDDDKAAEGSDGTN